MSIIGAQKGFSRLASAFIVGAALVLTYDGTMRFAQAHGALGWRGAVIAAMNDLAVLVGILWPERPLQALAGLCAGFTIWANIDHAAPGFAGLAVALIPPALAILMVGALEIVLKGSHRENPVPMIVPIEEPVPTEIPTENDHENDENPPFPLRGLDGKWDQARVLTWFAENPNGTLKEASAASGVPVSTISRWKKAA